MNELRLALVIAGLLLLVAIGWFGRHPHNRWWGKPVHDQRSPRSSPDSRPDPPPEPPQSDESAQPETTSESPGPATNTTPVQAPGQRPHTTFDRIITIYLAARDGCLLHGTDIVVAAEKVGLTYGHLDIFHRLLASTPERGPVFSVANLKPPNSFPLADIQTLETPALMFFLTLPAPLGALEAWDMMLPMAQRMAELLDAIVLDDQRSALTRQRIAGLRDELREWDRQHPQDTD